NGGPDILGVGLDAQGLENLADQVLYDKILFVEQLLSAFEGGDLVQVVHQVDQPVHVLGRILQEFLADHRVVHGSIEQRVDITLDRENGRLELVRQVLKELFAVGFVLFQQFYLLVALLPPFFHVFAYFIDAFLGQDVFEIDFLLLRRFCLVDQLIDQLDLPVDEFFEGKKDQSIAAEEDDQNGSCAHHGVPGEHVDAQGDGTCEQTGS